MLEKLLRLSPPVPQIHFEGFHFKGTVKPKPPTVSAKAWLEQTPHSWLNEDKKAQPTLPEAQTPGKFPA